MCHSWRIFDTREKMLPFHTDIKHASVIEIYYRRENRTFE